MGMIRDIFSALFGGRNLIRDTVEVFRPNAEKQEQREFQYNHAALQQFAGEFTQRKNWFDSLIDGINRIPRPALALGTMGLFVSAMYDPVWFSERMVGIALVPQELWWLLGLIVAFYFGGRHQAKTQAFDLQKTVSMVPQVLESQRLISQYDAESDSDQVQVSDAVAEDEEIEEPTQIDNPVLQKWMDENA